MDDACLHLIQANKPFRIQCDACDLAVGGVLEQQNAAGEWRPCWFCSSKLTETQVRWDVREKEAYAIIRALTKWQQYIGTSPVDLLSDHRTLESWYKEAVEIQGGPTSRRGRWHLTFSLFNVTVQYLPGVLNGSADALSRWAYLGAGDDDLTIHGTAEDAQAIADEKREIAP